MRLRFIGAIGGEVTGSCTLLHYKLTNIYFLVDCGMIQGESPKKQASHFTFPFNPATIKFVLLTHAHTDHCGNLPLLYKYGFQGKVYCTAATAQIASRVLKDYVRFDANAPYLKENVEQIQFFHIDDNEQSTGKSVFPLSADLFLFFNRTSHILGAVSYTIGWNVDGEQKKIVFSGDVGRVTEDNTLFPLLADCHQPFGYPAYIVIESTYGHANREAEFNSYEARVKKLAEIIKTEVCDQKKILFIPAFAVERSQDILFDLYYIMDKNIIQDIKPLTNTICSSLPVFLDGKLSSMISYIYAKELSRKRINAPDKYCYRNWNLKNLLEMDSEDEIDQLLTELYTPSKEIKDLPISKKMTIQWVKDFTPETLNLTNGAICLTGAGMCDGGPVVGHLKRFLSDENATFLLTGFCAPDTIGYQLRQAASLKDVDAVEKQKLTINLGKGNGSGRDNDINEDYIVRFDKIKSNILDMSPYYSSHADQNDLLRYLFYGKRVESKPAPCKTSVFINHGSHKAQQALKEAISQFEPNHQAHRDIQDVYIPKINNFWFDLTEGKWEERGTESMLMEIIELLTINNQLIFVQNKMLDDFMTQNRKNNNKTGQGSNTQDRGARRSR